MNAPRSKSRIATVAASLHYVLVASACAAVLVGCASVRENVGGWFGMAEPSASVPPEARTPATVYYAGGGNLRVFRAPSRDAEVLGTLSRHEKVTRSGLKNGFAYIENARGDLKGWVVNSRLIAKLPLGEAGRKTKSAAKTKIGAQPADAAAPGEEAEKAAPAAGEESEPAPGADEPSESAPAQPPVGDGETRQPETGPSEVNAPAPPKPGGGDGDPAAAGPRRAEPARPKPTPQGTVPSIFDAY